MSTDIQFIFNFIVHISRKISTALGRRVMNVKHARKRDFNHWNCAFCREVVPPTPHMVRHIFSVCITNNARTAHCSRWFWHHFIQH